MHYELNYIVQIKKPSHFTIRLHFLILHIIVIQIIFEIFICDH